jgi:hypothetical protein
MTTVKSIETSKFAIQLSQLKTGAYIISYVRAYPTDAKAVNSEAGNDLAMASYMFDLKLMELEGQ